MQGIEDKLKGMEGERCGMSYLSPTITSVVDECVWLSGNLLRVTGEKVCEMLHSKDQFALNSSQW